MGIQKHFTTDQPHTLFSVSQLAALANVSRGTVLNQWKAGKIRAFALDAKSMPLFSSDQAANISDQRKR